MPRFPIRLKLGATLAVPLSALVAVTSIELAALASDVDQVESQTELATAAVGPGGLITRLQNERSFAAVSMVGSDVSLRVQVPVQGFDETRAQTDEAIESVRREIAARGPRVVAAYRPAMDGLAALGRIRAGIDALRATPEWNSEALGVNQNEMYHQYTSLIRPFFDATSQVVLAIDDEELRAGAELVNQTARHIELFLDAARWIAVINGRQGGVDTRLEIRELTLRKVLWDPLVADIEAAPAPYDDIVADLWPRDFVGNLTSLLDRSLSQEVLGPDAYGPPLQTTNWGGLVEFRLAMADELTDVADGLAADARERERVFVVVAAAVLCLALVLTWVVSRSITRPLRSLTAQAKDMASTRLPSSVREVLQTPLGEDVTVPRMEPVTVRTRDEVLDVADALNTVQDTALELAVEQAVLRRNIADSFVNLGRRNQNLLVRQLDLITRLENAEVDADSLANLFRLDHLATRMRRNAESLLVLAGIEPPRQWARPVSVSDVVRAALGEVEDYQRVAVRDLQPATVMGSAAADLAHLLAELIENALVFSPEDRAVEVRGQVHPDGAYTLVIIDRGVGMSPGAIEASNRRLAGYESFTVAPSKYLGHYVAGNLAARHGIVVRLEQSIGTRGVTATVELPSGLLAQQTPPPGGREPALAGAGSAGYAAAPWTGPPPSAPPGPPAPAPAPWQQQQPQQPAAAAAAAGGVPGAPVRPSWWEATAPPPAAAQEPGAYGRARAN